MSTGWPTYVDELIDIASFQVPQDRSIVKVGQVGHVFAFLVFGGVHLLQLIFLERLLLHSVAVVSQWWAHGGQIGGRKEKKEKQISVVRPDRLT